MKKLKYRRAFSQEQPSILETSIFAEQQQQAKSGNVENVSGSNTALRTAVAETPTEPKTAKLSGIAHDALAYLNGAEITGQKIVINLATGKVAVVASGDSQLASFLGDLESLVIDKDDDTKASSTWTPGTPTGAEDPGMGAFEALSVVNEKKPVLSGAAVVDQIEDALLEGAPDVSGLLVIDPTATTIKLAYGGLSTVAAMDLAACTEVGLWHRNIEAAAATNKPII